MSAFVFIDTNILLDFYRVRGFEGGLSLLAHIDNHHDKIITSSQVEMEYKKNRQRVILESLSLFKTPQWNSLTVPTFLAQARPSQVIENSKKNINKQTGLARRRIEAVLANPGRFDPVYGVAQRLFGNQSGLNLDREKPNRYGIRRLAWKRFILGYPPRKPQDTSMGDAINWEWMIECCKSQNRDLILVSRDADYGHSHQGASFLNDWLLQEFRQRAGRRRQVLLTEKLAEAFRLAAIRVTKKEEDQELQLIEEIKTNPANVEWERVLSLFSPEEATALRTGFRHITPGRPLKEVAALAGMSPGDFMAALEPGMARLRTILTAAGVTKEGWRPKEP